MSTDLHDQSENAGRLGEVLSEWVVDAPLPPHFQARVWQRIAQAERQADFTVWDAILRRAQALLTRPKIALACGLLDGTTRKQSREPEFGEEIYPGC
jgi:hypothetical protein